MIGYLSHYKKLPMEEIVDEMLAILSDRNRIMQKYELADKIMVTRQAASRWEHGV